MLSILPDTGSVEVNEAGTGPALPDHGGTKAVKESADVPGPGTESEKRPNSLGEGKGLLEEVTLKQQYKV